MDQILTLGELLLFVFIGCFIGKSYAEHRANSDTSTIEWVRADIKHVFAYFSIEPIPELLDAKITTDNYIIETFAEFKGIARRNDLAATQLTAAIIVGRKIGKPSDQTLELLTRKRDEWRATNPDGQRNSN